MYNIWEQIYKIESSRGSNNDRGCFPLKQSITCVMQEDRHLTQHIPRCIWQLVSVCEVLWFGYWCRCVLSWGKRDTPHCRILAEVLRLHAPPTGLYSFDTVSVRPFSISSETHRPSLFPQSLLVWSAWRYGTSADDWLVTVYSTECQGPLILKAHLKGVLILKLYP